MNKVYIVWYDNGADYAEDSQTYIEKVFFSKDRADAYAEEKNSVSSCNEFTGFTPHYYVSEQIVED